MKLKAKIALTLHGILCLCLSGCATLSPSTAYDRTASELGFTRTDIKVNDFTLAVFSNGKTANRDLHIYLEGDGVPFHRRVHINPDPTSLRAVALNMMAKDTTASILIGRPCYHQLKITEICKESKWWTSNRYSENVVTALSDAIKQLVPKQKQITLIGFSGGGSLAVLIAEKLSARIQQVITVSANLDTKAWTSHNQYTPLFGSLNPIETIGNTKTRMIHLVGGKDKLLGAHYWLPKLKSFSKTKALTYPFFNHQCCWSEAWPKILNEHVKSRTSIDQGLD